MWIEAACIGYKWLAAVIFSNLTNWPSLVLFSGVTGPKEKERWWWRWFRQTCHSFSVVHQGTDSVPPAWATTVATAGFVIVRGFVREKPAITSGCQIILWFAAQHTPFRGGSRRRRKSEEISEVVGSLCCTRLSGGVFLPSGTFFLPVTSSSKWYLRSRRNI